MMDLLNIVMVFVSGALLAAGIIVASFVVVMIIQRFFCLVGLVDKRDQQGAPKRWRPSVQ